MMKYNFIPFKTKPQWNILAKDVKIGCYHVVEYTHASRCIISRPLCSVDATTNVGQQSEIEQERTHHITEPIHWILALFVCTNIGSRFTTLQQNFADSKQSPRITWFVKTPYFVPQTKQCIGCIFIPTTDAEF